MAVAGFMLGYAGLAVFAIALLSAGTDAFA
jgi:hypothetical protein